MKQNQLYRQLIDLANKMGIVVSEQNLRVTGVNAKSGLCRVKGDTIFIMDKHLAIHDKIAVLSDCLRAMPLENVYIIPAVRQFLEPPQ